ncbi:hypothetical protein GCM10010302_16730 [Streptomyces polychromogenes]|uniref:Uncharacterized protein n=1 Tax=Streptomyces polychromogenes TaxID=67342 RepID=A0ABP3EY99_9ACTN
MSVYNAEPPRLDPLHPGGPERKRPGGDVFAEPGGEVPVRAREDVPRQEGRAPVGGLVRTLRGDDG